jgi:hypothetical protein
MSPMMTGINLVVTAIPAIVFDQVHFKACKHTWDESPVFKAYKHQPGASG